MGREIEAVRFEPQDFERFAEALEQETEALAERLARGDLGEGAFTIGFELEACLLDRNYFPVAENERFLAKLAHPLVVPELSRFNVEINGTPQRLAGRAFSHMETELEQTWRRCLDAGHDVDATLIMTGILPTLRNRDLTLANISPRNRYYALNEQIMKQRAGRPLRLRIDGRDHLDVTHADVMLEAATTSFQVHLEAPPSEIARYYNASIILSAPLVALAANSPFLFGKSLYELLHMAREGLVLLGIDRDDSHRYLDLARARVRHAQNGANWQRAFVDRHGANFFRMTAGYLAHQRLGAPVHEWPI